MYRLYHSLRSLFLLPLKHKKTALGILFLGILLTLLSPFFKYLPEVKELAYGFFFGSLSEIKATSGRTNFLILGVDRRGGGAGGLTDTILFFSFDHSGKKHVVVSLPRDIWIPEIRAKLNTAYFYGNQVDGLGIEWAKRYVSQILGQPIHYSGIVSFEAFTRIIDALGGVDIDVSRSFVDEKYPIKGRENDDCGGDSELACRWETVKFEAGREHMTGARALQFARSRHAEGEEGTDFARSERQQKAILAVKDKLLSPTFLLNPRKVSAIVDIVVQNIETDVPRSQIGPLARALFGGTQGAINSLVLDGVYEEKPSLLLHPPISTEYDNQWVLIPENGDWTKVYGWFLCLLSGNECPVEKFIQGGQ